GKISSLFNQFLEQQAEIIRSVVNNSTAVLSRTKPLSAQSKMIAQNAHGMNSKTQSVASAVEESSVAITGISGYANEMERIISRVAQTM
ncbi:hypothetical protein ACI3PL_23885, partial [Lacticaseibacillus paracasei]